MQARKRFKTFRKPIRCCWFGMRVLPGQKESIRLASAAREMTMTEYLIHLHERAIGDGKVHA